MKSKTKKLVVLSFAAALCGALATGAMIASPQDVSASTATTFKMADGASIRYTKVGDKKEGLRFMVLADETTKNAIVESGKFGVIISTAADFANVDESADYLSQLDDMSYETNKEVTDSAAIEEMFYEGEKEYAGYWCANIVINMSSNADYDTVEDFTERTYSAVAYYPTGDDTYAYTENRQERSIQEVASSLYLQGDEKWAKVKETYPTIGTESTPILVAQNGKNAYKTLIEKVNASSDFGAGYYFELTENVLVEKVLSEDASFQGTFVGTYTATEPVGMIYDAKNATALNVTPKDGSQNEVQSVTVTKAFSENEKFDANSNGSAKITLTSGDQGASNVFFGVTPAFSEAYYNELISEGGYTHMVVRYKVERSSFVGTAISWHSDATGGSVSEYLQDGTLLTTPINEIQKNWRSDTWYERAIPVSSYNQILAAFFRINVFSENMSVTLYIDNIYLAKGLSGVDVEREANKGDTFNLSELQMTDVADMYGLQYDYKVDGATETFNGESVTLANAGEYDLVVRAHNRYGVRKASVVVKESYTLPTAPYAVVKEFAAAGDVIVSEISAVTTASGGTSATVTYTTDVKYDDATSQGAICISGINGGYWADISVVPTESKGYYEFLKANGYNYVTLRLGLIAKANDNAVYLYAGGSTNLHYNVNTSTVQYYKAADGALTNLGANGQLYKWLSVGAESWTEVSISIDTFLNNYNAQGTPILRVFGAYSNSDIYLDGVYVTKAGTLTVS